MKKSTISINKMIEDTEKKLELDRKRLENLKTDYNTLVESLKSVNPNINDDIYEILVLVAKSGIFNVKDGIEKLCDVLVGMRRFK